VLSRPDWIDAFTTSIRIAAITSACALALGVSAALGLVRGTKRWRGIASAIFLGPVLFPTIVIGIALLQWLVLLGVTRSIWSVALGHVVITMPFVIRFAVINLQSGGVVLERAARSLGASGWTAFWRVTLPNMRSALVGGGVLAFIISMIDVQVAIFVASVRVRTLPIKLFAHIDQNSDPLGAAVATIVLAICVVAMVVLHRTLGLKNAFAPQRSIDDTFSS
jgi:putative spermidine/putrescine transport system permease protein